MAVKHDGGGQLLLTAQSQIAVVSTSSGKQFRCNASEAFALLSKQWQVDLELLPQWSCVLLIFVQPSASAGLPIPALAGV